LEPFEKYYEIHEPALTFRAKTVADWQLWHDQLRAKVIELLGGFPNQRCDLQPQIVEEVKKDGYIQRDYCKPPLTFFAGGGV